MLSKFQIIHDKNTETSDPKSQLKLGKFLINSSDDRDRWVESIGLQHITESANSGNSSAQNYLGEFYYDGERIEKDLKTAFMWYTLAANQGNIAAKYSQGWCYYMGEGVEKNLKKAYENFNWGSEKEDSVCQNMMGIFYKEGIHVQINKNKAIKYFILSAEKGDLEGQFNLGMCYKNGFGVPKNIKECKKWLILSSNQGYKNAKQELFELDEFKSMKEKDINKAYIEYCNSLDNNHKGISETIEKENFEEDVKWYLTKKIKNKKKFIKKTRSGKIY